MVPLCGPEATLDEKTAADVPQAITRSLEISFDDYEGQVVPFLDPETRALHDSREAWDAMQSAVLTGLEALAP